MSKMVSLRMTCKECGNDSFKFHQQFPEEQKMQRVMCHSGYGLRIEDGYICCSKCEKWVDYEMENFLENKEHEEIKLK